MTMQEHIMCSLYIQTLPQLEVYKQSTDGDMHAIGRYFISEELHGRAVFRDPMHASNCKFL